MMKNNKKIGLFLVIISIFLIGLGVILNYVFQIQSRKNKSHNKTEIKMMKEHCLDNICIKNLTIFEENKKYLVKGILFNKTDEIIKSKYININYYLPDGRIFTQVYFIDYLEFGHNQNLFLSFPLAEITTADDYELEYTSQEEIEYLE